MRSRETQQAIGRLLQKPGNRAIAFFSASVALLTVALSSGWLLAILTTAVPMVVGPVLPTVFVLSTLLLAAGSVMLYRASGYVKLEKQKEFRRSLYWALLSGTVFVAVQTYGLSGLLAEDASGDVLDARRAAFAFFLLHAVHVVVALLFIVFVFLNALADRYDNEYSWGVTFCGWFWHGLGVVWCMILAVFLVAGTALSSS